MATSALRLLFLTAAPALTSATPGRQLRFSSHYHDHVWGWCDRSELTENGLGCYLNDNTTCSSHLSDGPADADVEVVVGNLPNGSHLQFWAAYESTGGYEILESPIGASIYIHPLDAFPNFWQPEFNGGNVPINESGHATIRVRRPATYLLHPFLVPVHVQLRVCNGDDVIMHPDTLYFDLGSQFVLTKSQDTPITLVSAHPYVHGSTSGGVSYTIPRPWAYVHGVINGSSSSDSVSTSTNDVGELSEAIQHAKDALDVAGLEESRVYNCFVRNQYFSHVVHDCVDECDQAHVAVHGQCVRREQSSSTAHFFVKWTLEVACAYLCGRDATTETLHRVRLQVATLLDVPFQEVSEVILHWDTAASRRLAVSTRTLQLQVTVSTRRWTAEHGRNLLDNLIANHVVASSLLQLPVKSVEGLSHEDPLDASDVDSVGFGSDPYEPAYEFVAPDRRGDDMSADDVSEQVVLVVGLSLGVVALGSIIGGGVFCRHQRARRQRAAVENKVADPFDDCVPPAAPVPTEIGQPNAAVRDEENNEEVIQGSPVGAGVLSPQSRTYEME